jgi:hypothetical protein
VRIRTIKPEFWESESLGRVSREARLLFIGLFSCCDDSGRTRASSRLLASRLYPYDTDAAPQIEGWLSELEGERCIRRYVVDGEQYLDIPKWLSHQKIDRPSASKIPEFVEGSRGIAKCSLGTGNGNREQGIAPGEEFALEAEPQGAGSAEPQEPKKQRPRNPSLDTLVEVSGWSLSETSPTGWGRAAKALKDIRAVSPEVTPEEIRARASRYRKEWPNAELTPTALAANWGRFGGLPQKPISQQIDDLEARLMHHACHPSKRLYEEFWTDAEKAEYASLKEQLARLRVQPSSGKGAA